MKILYDFPTAVDLVGPVRCGKTDEERGRGLWSWCFHVPGQDRFTWFHIDPSRGSKVLKRYLGKTFRGIVGCDYFSAYRKFLRESDAWLQCAGRPDPGRKVSYDAAGPRHAQLRPAFAEQDQDVVPHMAWARGDARQSLGACGRKGPP